MYVTYINNTLNKIKNKNAKILICIILQIFNYNEKCIIYI